MSAALRADDDELFCIAEAEWDRSVRASVDHRLLADAERQSSVQSTGGSSRSLPMLSSFLSEQTQRKTIDIAA